MDMRYEHFCLADPFFYESPSWSARVGELFTVGRVRPKGWEALRETTWTVMVPPRAGLPQQGWKIHVSVTLDNASVALDAVWNYCVPRNIPFKFLPDRISLLQCNSKYADRSASGKFITIYPVGPGEFEAALRELGAALDGAAGPYILSDVRWGNGPLYVRYGGFAERHCRLDDGELSPAIADPEGRLVPDLREPRFVIPDWVRIPAFLVPAVNARLKPDAAIDFPFRIERPLHFSNGGGVYLATDTRTERRVVLREARPFAGLDGDGSDAVQRLNRERELLEKLSGSGVAPEVYEHFTCWEHSFLVEEYIEGDTLGDVFVQRFPLVRGDVTEDKIAAHAEWALAVLAKVRHALEVLHGFGIGFGDLHPHNIMVTPDGDVRFVDFELASYLIDQSRPGLGAPGYVPPDGRAGAETDLYALASLTLALFLPLTVLLPLDPGKAQMFAGYIARRFPVPLPVLAEATRTLRDRRPSHRQEAAGIGGQTVARLAADLDAGAFDWPALRDSIRDAILASATPDRDDRLFPGDIDQFADGGTGLAYGAAGVLYALARSGAGRYPEHERWLLEAARSPRDRRAGLYDGLHGVAYALYELGNPGAAMEVFESATRTPMDELPATLFSGLAGVGLNLLHFATLTGDTSSRAQAVEAGSRLAEILAHDRSAPGSRHPSAQRHHAGLMFGFSGQALLHIRLFEATGERQFLDLAEDALRRDLSHCVLTPEGSLLIDEGWRVEPYVAQGSAGIGLVLQEFLRHRENHDFSTALRQIRKAAEPEFIFDAGLFSGRAGLMASLSWLAAPDPAEAAAAREIIHMHVRRLAWHVIPYRDGAAFPGRQSLRLSMDLATGSAGVLFALSALFDDDGPALPFLHACRAEQKGGDWHEPRSRSPGAESSCSRRERNSRREKRH